MGGRRLSSLSDFIGLIMIMLWRGIMLIGLGFLILRFFFSFFSSCGFFLYLCLVICVYFTRCFFFFLHFVFFFLFCVTCIVFSFVFFFHVSFCFIRFSLGLGHLGI